MGISVGVRWGFGSFEIGWADFSSNKSFQFPDCGLISVFGIGQREGVGDGH